MNFNYLRKVQNHQVAATEGLVQQLLQRIWAIGLIESWFCIWEYLANPKLMLYLTPNPL